MNDSIVSYYIAGVASGIFGFIFSLILLPSFKDLKRRIIDRKGKADCDAEAMRFRSAQAKADAAWNGDLLPRIGIIQEALSLYKAQ